MYCCPKKKNYIYELCLKIADRIQVLHVPTITQNLYSKDSAEKADKLRSERLICTAQRNTTMLLLFANS